MSQSENLPYDFSKAPRHEDGYRRYVMQGIPPGGFLTAILSNDLREAVFRADSTNQNLIQEHVRFVYWELPMSCCGSTEKVQKWIESGGLEGK